MLKFWNQLDISKGTGSLEDTLRLESVLSISPGGFALGIQSYFPIEVDNIDLVRSFLQREFLHSVRHLFCTKERSTKRLTHYCKVRVFGVVFTIL